MQVCRALLSFQVQCSLTACIMVISEKALYFLIVPRSIKSLNTHPDPHSSKYIQQRQQGRHSFASLFEIHPQPLESFCSRSACRRSGLAAACWWIGGANLFLPKRPLCPEVSGFNWLVHTFSSRVWLVTLPFQPTPPLLFGSWCQQGWKCFNSLTVLLLASSTTGRTVGGKLLILKADFVGGGGGSERI